MTTHNLFISHSWSYSDQYDSLVSLLENRSDFDFTNHSVPKDDPIHHAGSDKELTTAIMAKKVLCETVLILAGVYASYSKWIDIDIDLAQTGFGLLGPSLRLNPGEAKGPRHGSRMPLITLSDGRPIQ
ncbi:MAG: TIR domain-containing protein [Rhodobacteraceae bacterium]|nr:TIR domain-containing protein [Paracoccaceae bacterium]MCY4195449.1 TIR domain-containing protein [Paracoccaceae bacterium]MCY4327480.1 TIR domain-containing protein [Paracoccaceae bacterium]